jgi:hypothetical protein
MRKQRTGRETCVFTPDAQARLQAAYNDTFSHTPVNGSHAVWQRIVKRIQDQRPAAPRSWRKNRHEWLSNFDIERVMRVYERNIPDFVYIDTPPIDFDKTDKFGQCVVSELCNLCLATLISKGKYRIGLVINTAPSNEQGAHWVSVFADLRPGIERVVYFDSYAYTPEIPIRTLMHRWSQQWHTITGHQLTCAYNSKVHQKRDSECGMYCLYFLHCCLFEIPMQARVDDEVVNFARGLLFKN